MPQKILLVEDDINITNIIKYILEQNGYILESINDGKKALGISYDDFSCILLDIMLPGADGFKILEHIRKSSDIPVIMLTASGDEDDKVSALNLGADDYITKPFSNKELVARINANIRRNNKNLEKTNKFDENGIYEKKTRADNYMSFLHGKVRVDVHNFTVFINNTEGGGLTAREFELLKYLYDNKNIIFTRDELLANVWGYSGYIGDLRAVDVSIKRLRDKIEPLASKPEILITKRSVGYYISADTVDG